MNIIVHTGGWDLGWDSVVGFGTFALAAATGWLAKKTADEIASQTRPVLVPAHGAESLTSEYLAKLLRVQIRNSGRGPALDVQATLNPGRLAPQPWHNASISPDACESLFFDGVSAPQATLTLVLRYRDLADQAWESSIEIEAPNYRFAAVRISRDRRLRPKRFSRPGRT